MSDDDPTRIARRPIEPTVPPPAYGAITFSKVATEGGVLCVECTSRGRRSALRKPECPAIRLGNNRYVLHATSGADAARTSRACIKRPKTKRRCSSRANRCDDR